MDNFEDKPGETVAVAASSEDNIKEEVIKTTVVGTPGDIASLKLPKVNILLKRCDSVTIKASAKPTDLE